MPELRFSQKLALLPFTVPECILDFLEPIESSELIENERFIASLNPEYLNKNKETMQSLFKKVQDIFNGHISDIQIEAFGKDLANGYWCKLTGPSRTIGIAFLLKSKTGNILKVEMLDTEFNEESLKAVLK